MNGKNSLTKPALAQIRTRVTQNPLTINKMSGFPRRPRHARETTYPTDLQSVTPHTSVARILLKGLVGGQFGRRNREDAHIWLEGLAGIAVATLVWP